MSRAETPAETSARRRARRLAGKLWRARRRRAELAARIALARSEPIDPDVLVELRAEAHSLRRWIDTLVRFGAAWPAPRRTPPPPAPYDLDDAAQHAVLEAHEARILRDWSTP